MGDRALMLALSLAGLSWLVAVAVLVVGPGNAAEAPTPLEHTRTTDVYDEVLRRPEPDLGNDVANTLAREMGQLDLGVPYGVTFDPANGSIGVWAASEAAVGKVEMLAQELGIEVRVLGPGEFSNPQPYRS